LLSKISGLIFTLMSHCVTETFEKKTSSKKETTT